MVIFPNSVLLSNIFCCAIRTDTFIPQQKISHYQNQRKQQKKTGLKAPPKEAKATRKAAPPKSATESSPKATKARQRKKKFAAVEGVLHPDRDFPKEQPTIPKWARRQKNDKVAQIPSPCPSQVSDFSLYAPISRYGPGWPSLGKFNLTPPFFFAACKHA